MYAIWTQYMTYMLPSASNIFFLLGLLHICYVEAQSDDRCSQVQCLNGGTCVIHFTNTTHCICQPDFTGQQCQEELTNIDVWVIVTIKENWDSANVNLTSLPGKSGVLQKINDILCMTVSGSCVKDVTPVALSPSGSVNLHYTYTFSTENVSLNAMKNRIGTLRTHIDGGTLDQFNVVSGSLRHSFGNGTYINEITPSTGPMFGGSIVTLVGKNLLNNQYPTSVKVLFGENVCEISSGNDVFIVCATSPVEESMVRTLLPTYLIDPMDNDESGVYHKDDKGFTYFRDPTITSLNPLNVFKSGGAIITVTGDYLDDVANAEMFTYVKYKEKEKRFTTPCSIKSNVTMTCISPAIDLSFGTTEKRRRRDIAIQIADLQQDIDEKPSRLRSHSRNKRQSNPEAQSINAMFDALIYLGFSLDHITTYENLTQALPNYSELIVYPDPTFFNFTEDGGVRVFRTYAPVTDKEISITGEYLNLRPGVRYLVTVGDANCSEVEIFADRLICKPPQVKPAALAQDNGNLVVRVELLGLKRQAVGVLQYWTSIEDDSDVFIGIIVGCVLGIVLLLGLIIAVAYRVCCRGGRAQGRSPNRSHSLRYAGKRLSDRFRSVTAPFMGRFRENPSLQSYPRASHDPYPRYNDEFEFQQHGRSPYRREGHQPNGRFDHHEQDRYTPHWESNFDKITPWLDATGSSHQDSLRRKDRNRRGLPRQDFHDADRRFPPNSPPPTYEESRPYHRQRDGR